MNEPRRNPSSTSIRTSPAVPLRRRRLPRAPAPRLQGQEDPGLEVLEDRQGLHPADRQLARELRALRRVRRGVGQGRRHHLLHRLHPGHRPRDRAARTWPRRSRSTARTSRSSRAIQECKAADVRMGMRVEAVWKPDGERQGNRGHPLLRRLATARRAVQQSGRGSPDAAARDRSSIVYEPRKDQLRNVAIVGFAQMPTVARDEHRMSTEMLYPVVREALAQVRSRARRHRLSDRPPPPTTPTAARSASSPRST